MWLLVILVIYGVQGNLPSDRGNRPPHRALNHNGVSGSRTTLPGFGCLRRPSVPYTHVQPLNLQPSISRSTIPFTRNEVPTTREEDELSTENPLIECGSGPSGVQPIQECTNESTDGSDQQPSCELCGRNFKKISYLKNHMKMHSDDRPYVCDVCGKACKKKPDLNTHMKIHSDARPFPCKTCGRSFKRSSTLRAHLKTHSEEVPFSCELCGKSFKTKTSLNLHMVSHSNDRPFSCDICGKNFKRKGILREHMILHSNPHSSDRSIPCTVCSKKCKNKSHLKIHMQTHSNDSPFSCEICAKSFKRKFVLQRHMKGHTDQRPSESENCDESSGTRCHERDETVEEEFSSMSPVVRLNSESDRSGDTSSQSLNSHEQNLVLGHAMLDPEANVESTGLNRQNQPLQLVEFSLDTEGESFNCEPIECSGFDEAIGGCSVSDEVSDSPEEVTNERSENRDGFAEWVRQQLEDYYDNFCDL